MTSCTCLPTNQLEQHTSPPQARRPVRQDPPKTAARSRSRSCRHSAAPGVKPTPANRSSTPRISRSRPHCTRRASGCVDSRGRAHEPDVVRAGQLRVQTWTRRDATQHDSSSPHKSSAYSQSSSLSKLFIQHLSFIITLVEATVHSRQVLICILLQIQTPRLVV